METLCQIPNWYILIGIVWSTYQGVRGAIEHRLNYANQIQQSNQTEKRLTKWKPWEKWMILYIHDFSFRFICTISGFISLYFAYSLSKDMISSLTTGSSVFIAFLFLIGVIGVGGQLHYVILMGKLPKYY